MAKPAVDFDGQRVIVRVPAHVIPRLPDDATEVELAVEPGVVYLVRIRRTTSEVWSPSFVTPFTNHRFEDLRPNTEYEIEVRAKNKAGPGEPAYVRLKTDPRGVAGNVIPFPKR